MKQKNSKLALCVLSALLLVGCATSTSSNQPTTSSQETTSSATTSKPQSSITKNLTGIEISKMPKKVKYEEGDIFDKSGLEVKAKYSDNKDEIIKDYTIDKEKTPLKLEDKEVIISYKGFTASIKITVIEKHYDLSIDSLGDHIFEAEDLVPDEKWIMRDDMISQGHTNYVVDSADSSNGKSIERYDINTVITLDFYTNEDITLKLSAVVSNYDEINLNDSVVFKVDDTTLVSDNPTLGHRNSSDWWNWKTALFNEIDLTKGSHSLTIKMYTARPNLDCFNFHVKKYGETVEEHKLTSISIDTMPTKTTYNVGEVFDPTGIKIKLNYSDSTYEISEDFTCDTTTPLTEETKNVEIKHGEFTTTVAITVINKGETISESKVIKLEAEDFDKTNLQNNGNGFVENTDFASGGKCLGNGTHGTIEWTYTLTKDMKLDILSVVCKYEEFFVKDYFKVFIDDVEVSLQDPELKLGRTDGNDWFNFKEANYVQQTLQAGTHKIKVQIGTEDAAGCNTDYIQFTFTEI